MRKIEAHFLYDAEDEDIVCVVSPDCPGRAWDWNDIHYADWRDVEGIAEAAIEVGRQINDSEREWGEVVLLDMRDDNWYFASVYSLRPREMFPEAVDSTDCEIMHSH